MLNLHLGCGNIKIPDFTNVDIVESEATDIIDDVVTLKKFKKNSVDLIYNCNVLEHLGRFKFKEALKRWYELLKVNGILRISVPNFEALCDYYQRTKDLDTIYCALYAGQNKPYNFHYWCWDFKTLKRDLEQIGFKDVKLFDRNILGIRDWSLNYVPYKDYQGNELPDSEWFKGTNIALNVECKK